MKTELEKTLDNLRGKHIKATLSHLERLGILTPALRKIILDSINDYARDISTALGYEVDE